MSENNSRKKKSRYEKAGFYTALSICLIAVTMAVYSTYNTISRKNLRSNPPPRQWR